MSKQQPDCIWIAAFEEHGAEVNRNLLARWAELGVAEAERQKQFAKRIEK
jgi:hypothetical protein